MVGNIRVLLTDEKDEGTSQLANALCSSRMDVKLCQKNGAELLNLIDEMNPDVVIMDAFMTNIDALGVVNNLGEMENKPFIERV
jgi:two-component system response regulator (stage 0 sporulation protein A)